MQYRPVIGGGLAVTGLLLAAIQLLQLTQLPGSSATLAFNTLPFVLVAAAISFTGVAIARDETYETYATRIIAWGVGSAVGFVAVFVLSTGSTEQAGLTLLLGAVDAGTAGGLAGLLIGLYDVKNRRTLATVEAFADKLDGLNQYGKVLNQSTDIESVSALCIEVVEFVLGGDGAVFLTDHSGAFEPVSSTVLEADTARSNGPRGRWSTVSLWRRSPTATGSQRFVTARLARPSASRSHTAREPRCCLQCFTASRNPTRRRSISSKFWLPTSQPRCHRPRSNR